MSGPLVVVIDQELVWREIWDLHPKLWLTPGSNSLDVGKSINMLPWAEILCQDSDIRGSAKVLHLGPLSRKRCGGSWEVKIS